MLELQIKLCDEFKQKPDFDNLIFGKHTTDYMFSMDFCQDKGWHDAKIAPYAPLVLDPLTTCLHYGQELFEGMKAYKNNKNELTMFRPIDNLNRLNKSAERMCMPQIDVDFVMNALIELIRLEKDWVPQNPDASLYIRPTMIGTTPMLGIKPSSMYKLFVVLSPVGPYFGNKMEAVNIWVEDKYARACHGGTGEAKCAGNYAASLIASAEAAKKGFTQVLWLDSANKKYVEEVGAMNIFFVINDEIITPCLTGTILRGITRDSVIKLMTHMGYKVTERMITIDEIYEEHKRGNLKECFGTGTAAIVAPVGKLSYKDNVIILNNGEVGNVSKTAYDNLLAIQKGLKPDPFNWVVKL